MQAQEVNSKEYNSIFSTPYHVFNKVSFNELNKDKCDDLKYLIFKDNKIRLGLIAGLKENILHSPFSAPCGGFSFVDPHIQIQKIEESFAALNEYCLNSKIKGVKFVLPPLFYDHTFLSKVISAAIRDGYKQEYFDLNYSFNLDNFDKDYIEKVLWCTSRRNLKIAISNNLLFKKVQSPEEIKIAYETIEQNRKIRGFPLRMSLDQVLNTLNIVKSDIFLLYSDDTVIASAIIFHVSDNIVQVIYWGDLPQFSDKKTMNFLSYKVFEYYKNTKIKHIDIGISTDQEIPNYGLCEFKESIGCDVFPKYTFSKHFYD